MVTNEIQTRHNCYLNDQRSIDFSGIMMSMHAELYNSPSKQPRESTITEFGQEVATCRPLWKSFDENNR